MPLASWGNESFLLCIYGDDIWPLLWCPSLLSPSCSLSAIFSYSLLCVLATTPLPVPPCPPAPLPSPALGDGARLMGEECFSEKLHERQTAHASGEGEHTGHPAVPFPLQPCCTFHFWLGRGVRGNFILLLQTHAGSSAMRTLLWSLKANRAC